MPTEKAHGIQIMKMCEAFASLLDVELIIPRRFNDIKQDAFEYYGTERNFKIKKLPCLDLIVLDKYIGHLGLWIESLTFFISVFFYLLFTPLEDSRLSLKNRPYLSKNLKRINQHNNPLTGFKKADIFYTRDILLLPLAVFKKDLVYEAHTFPGHYFLYSLLLKRVKRIITITQKLKDLFIEKGIPSHKILVASDGVDLEKFDIKETQEECRRKLNLPRDKKIVLYAGHLYEWKGAATLLKAAWKFQIPNSKFQILFVFVGGIKEDIMNFRQKAKDLNNVKIIGHRPHSEVPYWLKAADVLILPNSGKEEISKHWTSPLKLFEYMAAKKPIVASDLPSIREILNEFNSVLVKADNSESLASGINKVLENSIREQAPYGTGKTLTEKISTKAYEDVQNYTWDIRAKSILIFIKNNVKLK